MFLFHLTFCISRFKVSFICRIVMGNSYFSTRLIIVWKLERSNLGMLPVLPMHVLGFFLVWRWDFPKKYLVFGIWYLHFIFSFTFSSVFPYFLIDFAFFAPSSFGNWNIKFHSSNFPGLYVKSFIYLIIAQYWDFLFWSDRYLLHSGLPEYYSRGRNLCFSAKSIIRGIWFLSPSWDRFVYC